MKFPQREWLEVVAPAVAIEVAAGLVATLKADDLGDARVRAKLHGVRKALDRLLEQAERTRPCTR